MTAAAWPAMTIAQAHALLTAPGSPCEMEEVAIGGVETRVWKNAPPSLRAVVEMGRAHGDKVFLVYEDERVTFEAFHRAVAAFAHELRAQGVAKGDRVAIVMRNIPEWPVAFYAAAALGAIVTPLNAWWTGAELEYGLIDSGAIDVHDPRGLIGTSPDARLNPARRPRYRAGRPSFRRGESQRLASS